MSQSDSFLNEVSEEVRRDRFVATFRRNAVWIGLVVVLVIGAAAAWEWRKASVRAAAEARGEALWAALEEGAEPGLIDSIELTSTDGAALLALHKAALAVVDEDPETAVTELSRVAGDGTVDTALRDIARLKLAAVGEDRLEAQERIDILETLTADGHPLRALALEQRALVHLGEGDPGAAVSDLTAALATGGLDGQAGNRIAQLLQALGGADEAADEGGDEVGQDG